MLNEVVDYEEDYRGYSIFYRDQEVQSSHMKVPSNTFVKEEVRDPSSMTTEFTQISDKIFSSKILGIGEPLIYSI